MIKTFTKLFALMACIAMFNTASAQADGNITVTVDMSEYTGGFTTVFMAGTFNGWTDANPLTDNGDGTWTTTVMLTGGDQEYKFMMDNWAAQEEFAGGESCTVTVDGFTNRVVSVDGDATIDAVCFASCDACAGGATGQVTVTVDMSEYTESFTTVFLSGAFNGWGGGNNPMTDNGDGTWTTTVTMANGAQEYKFQLDEWAAQEEFAGGESCTVTTDGFTNRVVTVDGDTTVDPVCFASCFACGATSLSEAELASVNMESFPNPTDNVLNVQFETPVSAEATLNMTNVLGKTVQNIELGTLNAGDHTERLDVSRLNAGVYVLTLQLDGQIARTQNIVIQ